jgi:hypothetical protein
MPNARYHSVMQEFERSVEKDAIHPLTNVHMAEKVLQWQSQVKPYHFFTIIILTRKSLCVFTTLQLAIQYFLNG